MASSLFQKIRSSYSWKRLAIGLILLLGIVLRLKQYFIGRSLWLDEAMLALNIVNRDFAGLFRPLDYDQGAPIGFLLVEKFFNIVFGDHEFVLRFFPMLVGIAALFVFYQLLRHTTSGIGLLTGLAVFAVAPRLVYYSSELKQYIVDVGVTVFLLSLAVPIFIRRAEKEDYLYLGLAGILSLWFSHPALFVLTGIGIGILIHAIEQRERYHISMVLLIGILWLANLGALYFISLQGLSQNRFLLEYWQENFMPLPPWSDWEWFTLVLTGLVRDQIGILAPIWLVYILMIAGLISVFRKNKICAIVFLTVFALSLIAASLQVYPLGGRLSLFLVPLMIILIAQSIDSFQSDFKLPYKFNLILALSASVFVLYSPLAESMDNFINPKYFEHIRPSMATLSENWEEGDVLFVSHGAVPAFRFYADRYGLGDLDFQTSETTDYSEPKDILPHLQTLDGRTRVWVLITHVYESNSFNEKDFLLSALDTLGEHKREFRSPGTSVYLFLYDLSQ